MHRQPSPGSPGTGICQAPEVVLLEDINRHLFFSFISLFLQLQTFGLPNWTSDHFWSSETNFMFIPSPNGQGAYETNKAGWNLSPDSHILTARPFSSIKSCREIWLCKTMYFLQLKTTFIKNIFFYFIRIKEVSEKRSLRKIKQVW